MTSSPSWITLSLSPSHPSEGIIERRAARPPGARPGRPGITPGEYSNGASGENHSGSHKLKTLLRQAPERTRDGLWQRIGALLDQFTPDECANYLQAAGYADSF